MNGVRNREREMMCERERERKKVLKSEGERCYATDDRTFYFFLCRSNC